MVNIIYYYVSVVSCLQLATVHVTHAPLQEMPTNADLAPLRQYSLLCQASMEHVQVRFYGIEVQLVVDTQYAGCLLNFIKIISCSLPQFVCHMFRRRRCQQM